MTEKTLDQDQEATSAPTTKGTQKDLQAQIDALQKQLRDIQSTKDKEVAQERARATDAASKVSELQTQMEALISDPAARQEFRVKRMEAELQTYRAREGINQHRQLLVNEYGVPRSVLEQYEDPGQMTDAALRWWRNQAQATSPEKTEKVAELESLKAQGAHDVSTSPAPSPDSSSAVVDDVEKEIQRLRAIAKLGGTKGEKARLEILKQEAKRTKPPVTRARL